MAEILPIRRKTLYDQSIKVGDFLFLLQVVAYDTLASIVGTLLLVLDTLNDTFVDHKHKAYTKENHYLIFLSLNISQWNLNRLNDYTMKSLFFFLKNTHT